MNEETGLVEKFRELVGVESEPQVWEVEKGHIRRHAEAVGDPNPLWRDEAYARKTRYGFRLGRHSALDRLVFGPDYEWAGGLGIRYPLDLYRRSRPLCRVCAANILGNKNTIGKSSSMMR